MNPLPLKAPTSAELAFFGAFIPVFQAGIFLLKCHDARPSSPRLAHIWLPNAAEGRFFYHPSHASALLNV